MRPLVILIAVIAVFALIEKGLRSAVAPHPAAHATAQAASPKSSGAATPAIVMYTAEDCGYCESAREYFADKGVSVTERDIGASEDAANEFAQLHGFGTPLILIGDERIDGFDEDELDDALERAGI